MCNLNQLIVNVCSDNDNKGPGFEYTNITGMKLEGLVCQVLKACNEYAHEQNNCVSSEPESVQLRWFDTEL